MHSRNNIYSILLTSTSPHRFSVHKLLCIADVTYHSLMQASTTSETVHFKKYPFKKMARIACHEGNPKFFMLPVDT